MCLKLRKLEEEEEEEEEECIRLKSRV